MGALTEGWAVAKFAVPRIDIRTQSTPDNVAQMWDIVHIWERGGDENVLLPRDGQNWVEIWRHCLRMRGWFAGLLKKKEVVKL